MFDQSALDDLLKEDDERRAHEMAESPDEGAIDQERINALLREGLLDELSSETLEISQPSSTSGSGGGSTEEADGIFDQSAIDALLSGASFAAPPAGAADEPLDQDAINALLNANTQISASPVLPEEGLDQAAIDAVLQGTSMPKETARAEDDALDQAAIDAMLRGASTPPEPASKGLDQNDIDALLDEVPSEAIPNETAQAKLDQSTVSSLMQLSPDENASADDGVLDQSAIDALLKTSSPSSAVPEDAKVHGLDQSDIDAMLAGDDLDKPLVEKDPEGPVVDEGPIDQSAIDSLIQDLTSGNAVLSEAPSPENIVPITPPKDQPVLEEAPLSQEMIDALISSGGDESQAKEISPPPVTEKPSSSGGLLSQEDLDNIIAQAKARPKKKTLIETPAEPVLEEVSAVQETPAQVAAPRKKRRPFPKPSIKISLPTGKAAKFLSENFLKLTVSMVAAVVVTLATFTYLYTHQERQPDSGALAGLATGDLTRAMTDAQHLMDTGRDAQAVQTLDSAIEKTASSPSRTEAEYMRAEAAVRALPAEATAGQVDSALDIVNRALESDPNHPQAPEAQILKANLYKRMGNTLAALETYKRVLEAPQKPAHPDVTLSEGARLALEAGKPDLAAQWANQLAAEYPASAYTGDARLLAADALRAAGRVQEAESLYRQLAQIPQNPRLAAKAIARLGQSALEQGRTDEAIALLEARISNATTVEGNDGVYLALSKAYRSANRTDDAQRTLNDLIEFFPDSEMIPQAYVELVTLLEQLEQPSQAVRVAQQAVTRYEKNPQVLKAFGDLLASTGNKQKAAETLLSAYRAGAQDPENLLKAARLLMDCGKYREAEKAYGVIVAQFPDAPQAFLAGIESAECVYKRGKYERGLQDLQNIAAATPEGPKKLPVLAAQGDMYQELGLTNQAAEMYRKVASMSSEPELLAKSAISLFDAGATDDALAAAARVDVSKLTPEIAHTFLREQGNALMKADPSRAADVLTRISTDYADLRTADDEKAIMKAYAATNNVSGMQALLDDLQQRVQKAPREAPRLTAVALDYADYLYDKADWQTAADTYAVAIASEVGDTPDAAWARYQRANAFLRMADFENSIVLYDQIAAGKSSWAQDAKLKADYARLEQRLRGLPVSPKQETGQTGQTGSTIATAGSPQSRTG